MTIFNEFIPKLKDFKVKKEQKLKKRSNESVSQESNASSFKMMSETEDQIDEMFRETTSFLKESVEIDNSLCFLEAGLKAINQNKVQRLPMQYEGESVLDVKDLLTSARVTTNYGDEPDKMDGDNEVKKEKATGPKKVKKQSIIERNKRQLKELAKSAQASKTPITNNPPVQRKLSQLSVTKPVNIPESTKLMLLEAKRKYVERYSNVNVVEVPHSSIDLKIL
jgi:hypothetical protein